MSDAPDPPRAEAIHASCVVVGETGILLRGPSGGGKSTLARRLVEEAARRGLFARIVADDRVVIRRQGGRAIARPHPAIAGLVESRGLGILEAPHEPACVLGLVVTVGGGPAQRLPEPSELLDRELGMPLPHFQAGHSDADRVLLALDALGKKHAPREPRDNAARSWGLHFSPHRTK